MKQLTKLLLIYIIVIFGLSVTLLFSRVEFSSDTTEPFTLSNEAKNFGEEQGLQKEMIDPVIEFIYDKALVELASGFDGPFTAESSNPYLFQRDWSQNISDYKAKPKITIKTSLFKDQANVLFLITQYSMPLIELNEERGLNFLRFGFSEEYTVSRLYAKSFYVYDNEYIEFTGQETYDSNKKVYTLPQKNELAILNEVSVTGYLVLEIPVDNELKFFEYVVSVNDGRRIKNEPGIVVGLNEIKFAGYETSYFVSASWVKYIKENE